MTRPSREERERLAFDRLAAAVDDILRAQADLRQRLGRAETRLGELESVLAELSGDETDVVAMAQELRACRDENASLRMRLEEGQDAVDRILSRIRYLSEQG